MVMDIVVMDIVVMDIVNKFDFLNQKIITKYMGSCKGCACGLLLFSLVTFSFTILLFL